MVDPNTRQGKRAPVTLKIKFKSATLEQFIERYAVDVSHGGIFIRTKEPLAVGTQMRFEFQLRDATPLITGEGTVVWTRENDPARPGVAPGMGVRFDRLNEGSQQILDRILAEKAKGVGTHAPSDTKPPIFNEAPTKVAPSPLVGALKDESKPKIGQMAPPRAGFGDERTDATPLPKPMPFHSDADEFPEEAFEEATKVRSLEDLVAQTKDIDGMSPAKIAAAVAAKSSGPLMDDKATTKMPSAGGLAAPVAAVLTPPPAPVAPSHAAETAAAHAAAAHAAALKDELAERRAAKMADPEPIAAAPVPEAPKLPIGGTTTEPSLPSLPPFREPAFVQKASSFAATPAPAPSSKAKPAPAPSPKGKAAAAAPEPVREAPPRGAPVGLLLLLLVVLGGAAAFWFFYLRNRGDHGSTGGEGSGSISDDDNGSGSASGPASGSASGSGSAIASGAGSAVAGSASGTGAASGGSGSASGSAVATADLADVAITSSTAGATVDIADAGVTGAALPYKGQLEKGKTFTAHVSAPGHIAQDVDLTGGGKAIDVKLKAMPHVVHITSTPGGAMIFVDGQPTRRTTPGDVDITAAQAATGARIELRKAGYDRFVKSIRSDAFSEDTDHLLANLDATLVVARVVPQNGGGNVIRHPGGGSGSSTGSGSSAGSGSASGAGSGSVGPVTMPGGSGSGSGSATAGSASTGSGSAGSATTTTGSGASTGSGAGSASSSSGTGSGAGSSKGSGAGSSSAGSGSSSAGSGSGSGSEPTPDWMK